MMKPSLEKYLNTCVLVCSLLFSIAGYCVSLADLPVVPPSVDFCIAKATEHYQVPPDLVRAIQKTENGCGRVATNTNGSFDMGCMQINSIHLSELAGYGITKKMLVNNERCINVFIGTWMIKKLIRSAKTPEEFWVQVGSYNSTPTKKNGGVYNRRYQKWVWKNLKKIQYSNQPIMTDNAAKEPESAKNTQSQSLAENNQHGH